jgi:hypothetical protein
MLYKNKILKLLCICLFSGLLPLPSQATIPVTHIKGVDELFAPSYKIYSPLTGLLQHSTFLPKTLPDADASNLEPIQNLLSSFFVKVSADEIFTSHVLKNPAAHFSGGTIAKIFIEFERAKAAGLTTAQMSQQLPVKFMNAVLWDEGYQKNLLRVDANIQAMRAKHESLLQRFNAEQLETAVAEEFREKNYGPIKSMINKMTKQVAIQAKQGKDTTTLATELAGLEVKRVEVYRQYAEMLEKFKARGFVTKTEKNKSESDLKRYVENNDLKTEAYLGKLTDLVKTIADCFVKYDLVDASLFPRSNRYATTSALLSVLWVKYTDKKDLAEYIYTMAQAGFLNSEASVMLDESFYNDHYTQQSYIHSIGLFSNLWFKKQTWVNDHFTDSLLMSSDFSGNSKVPPYVAWSATWATYHLDFQDCVENVLHNLFLLITFNEKTDQFDYRILEQLKAKYYPDLSPKLIEYFKTYPTEADHNSVKAIRAWVDLVSAQNRPGVIDPDQKIGYGIEKLQRDIIGPYSNGLKVLNTLFGFSDIKPDRMEELFARTHEVANALIQADGGAPSAYQVIYSRALVNGNATDAATFGVGKRRFEIVSYGERHVTFKLLQSDSGQVSENIAGIFGQSANGKNADPVMDFRYSAGLEYLKKARN